MRTTRQLSLVFLGVYVLMWVLGPVTQLLFIVNQPLHTSWGLSEPLVRARGYEWLLADEMAIAWADMTYLVAGVVFVAGALMRRPWSLASTRCPPGSSLWCLSWSDGLSLKKTVFPLSRMSRRSYLPSTL